MATWLPTLSPKLATTVRRNTSCWTREIRRRLRTVETSKSTSRR